MNSIDFLNYSSQRVGFKREVFIDENVPTDVDNFLFVPIFSDFKHSFIFSSILLDKYKNKTKNSKYIIVCSYPGFSSLFKDADEYWSLSDFKNFKNLFEYSQGFLNKSKTYLDIIRNFNENYRNVINSDFFNCYYNNGFKEKFWTEYDNLFLRFPMISSSAVLGKEVLRTVNESHGYKVFIFPSIYLNSWNQGKNVKLYSQKQFYVELIKYLKSDNIFPVVWNHPLGHDLTNEFSNHSDCLFINEFELSKVLSSIRMTGCNLDLFSGTNWLAKIARTPSLTFDERSKFYGTKENELVDLSLIETPNKFVFNFVNSVVNGSIKSWKEDIFLNIKNNLLNFTPYLDRESWASTAETDKEVSIENFKKRKIKRLGTKFIKIKD